VLLVYTEAETRGSDYALGSKECRKARTERRIDVEVVGPTQNVRQAVEKGMMGASSVLKTHEYQSKKGVMGCSTIKYEEPLRHRESGCRKPK
jgi:hypothetical protein